MMDFGKTYTVNAANHNPMTFANSSSTDQCYDENISHELGFTYTKPGNAINLMEDKYSNIFPGTESQSAENVFGVMSYGSKMMQGRIGDETENSGVDSSEREKYSGLYCVGKSTMTAGNFQGPLSENSYNIRPHLSKKSGDTSYSLCSGDSYRHQQDSIMSNLMKKDADTTSNDGSECTVISLGRKIQLMAASSQAPQEVLKETKEQLHNGNWDSEWKQLLKQNHELLLKLSSRDDGPLNENAAKCDHTRTILVHDSGVQTNGNASQIPSLSVESAVTTIDDVLDKADSGICSSEMKCDSDLYPSLAADKSVDGEESTEDGDFQLKSDVPECILEDILEESSQSSKSTPRQIENLSDSNNLKENVSLGPSTIFKENSRISKSYNTSPTHTNNSSSRGMFEASSNVLSTSCTVPEATVGGKDFSCLANLPTYRLGATAGFVMKSLFPINKQTTRSVASKDLLEALQMIEDNENKSKSGGEMSLIEHDFKSVSPPSVHNVGINTNGMMQDSSFDITQKFNGSNGFNQR